MGSSRSSTRGFMVSTEAMATFFFSPPESMYDGLSLRVLYAEHGHHLTCPVTGFGFRYPELHRPEKKLVQHGGAKELNIGILKDIAYTLPEITEKPLVLERLRSNRMAR